MEIIDKVFKEKPNENLEELFNKYHEAYNKENKCREMYAMKEAIIEHDKLNRIDNLMTNGGFNITTARNKVEAELAEDRFELVKIDHSIHHYRMEKKVFRLLIEYMME